MDDSILLPVDGSASSVAAAEHAIAIARATGAPIHVLAVHELTDVEHLPADEREPLREASKARSREAANSVADRVENAGVTAIRTVREGVPYRVIVDVVAEADTELIVMGTRGLTAARETVTRVGITTERVLTLTDVPVLAVPLGGRQWADTDPTGPNRIVIPTDGSDAAERAADCALELATHSRGAVDVISVIDETDPALEGAPAAIIELCREGGHDAIEPIAIAARNRELSVTAEIVRGVPHDAIVSYAAAVDADLIAMGSRGLATADEPLLGSTTVRVLERSDRPVLAVR